MSSLGERNQFRRLVGDYGKNEIPDSEIESYLDDATSEGTSLAYNTPIRDYDQLDPQYSAETIYLAAINYWWDRASKLADRHSQTVGSSSQNVGEKWDRAMEMIQRLQAHYDTIQLLQQNIYFGNNSRFSKSTLTRIGGQQEETALDG